MRLPPFETAFHFADQRLLRFELAQRLERRLRILARNRFEHFDAAEHLQPDAVQRSVGLLQQQFQTAAGLQRLRLLEGGGSEIACGWLKDKFGLRWQVTPARIGELLRTPAAMQAMMRMKKFDIAELERAGRG